MVKKLFFEGIKLLLVFCLTFAISVGAMGMDGEAGSEMCSIQSNEPCIKCDPTPFSLTPSQWTTTPIQVTRYRCVEYDSVLPHHCAEFQTQYFEIWENDWPFGSHYVSDWYQFDCEQGTPLPEECPVAWWAPWTTSGGTTSTTGATTGTNGGLL